MMQEEVNTPGELLRKIRMENDLTQEKLGIEIGVHPVYISQLECVRKKISKRYAMKFASFFHIDYRIFIEKRLCVICKNEFEPQQHQRFCSKKCRDEDPSNKKRRGEIRSALYYSNVEKNREIARIKGRENYRKKNGLPLDTPRLIGEAGKGHINKSGYKFISKPGHPNAYNAGNYRWLIAEHIFVMSEYLGRPLRKGENVHHKNGIRHDNRIENLELWHKAQPCGQRVEDKIAWAKEFLMEYGYEVKEIFSSLK
jgi:transcriptional regulator with XRE-family HTH domain